MATTEERLAALEAKLAALTATTPTEYYTHQYSGEEIDAAVGRALTGGALDTSVTNVSNQLGTFVRPNLLDNWYFGNPVDQRGGKIIQHGKMAYRDAACTIEQGPVDETAKPVYKVSDQVYAFTDGDNNTYYVKAADVVRGYTGKVYGVDRWSSLSNIVTMVVGDDGLTVSSTAESGAVEICQYFESYIKAGTILTLSAIVSKTEASQNGILRVKVYGGGADLQTNLPARAMDHELVSVTNAARADVIGCVMRISNGDGYTVHAIKLELGDTQTLAHQDAAGNWVLNEVPEYGEQLRRCQRYCRVYKAGEYLPCLAYAESDGWYLSASMYIGNMRTTPINNLGSGLSCSVSNIDGGTSIDKTITNWGIVGSTIQRLRISGGDKTPGHFPYNVMPKQDLIFSADL